MIDLHTHSTCSDGSFSPSELAAKAIEEGLTGLALTDHDSTEGLAGFLQACEGTPLRGIGGVEISADYEPGTMHMLGYCFDTANANLQQALLQIRDGRNIRNRKIVEQLAALGVEIAWDDILKKSGGDVVGRPHIAKVMLDKGYIKNIKEAFNKYLAKGKPGYVDRFRLTPEDSIQLIRGAGGVACIAHPSTLRLDDDELAVFLGRMKDDGLQGLEVYYPEHKASQVEKYEKIADDLGLVKTGGTDFHGDLNPDIKLGRGFGSLNIPDELMDELSNAAGRE